MALCFNSFLNSLSRIQACQGRGVRFGSAGLRQICKLCDVQVEAVEVSRSWIQLGVVVSHLYFLVLGHPVHFLVLGHPTPGSLGL